MFRCKFISTHAHYASNIAISCGPPKWANRPWKEENCRVHISQTILSKLTGKVACIACLICDSDRWRRYVLVQANRFPQTQTIPSSSVSSFSVDSSCPRPAAGTTCITTGIDRLSSSWNMSNNKPLKENIKHHYNLKNVTLTCLKMCSFFRPGSEKNDIITFTAWMSMSRCNSEVSRALCIPMLARKRRLVLTEPFLVTKVKSRKSSEHDLTNSWT